MGRGLSEQESSITDQLFPQALWQWRVTHEQEAQGGGGVQKGTWFSPVEASFTRQPGVMFLWY
jgi:hypothetical protein